MDKVISYLLFQSHAGSIEARLGSWGYIEIYGFNPTLVRLRLAGFRWPANGSNEVSIPRWFD